MSNKTKNTLQWIGSITLGLVLTTGILLLNLAGCAPSPVETQETETGEECMGLLESCNVIENDCCEGHRCELVCLPE